MKKQSLISALNQSKNIYFAGIIILLFSINLLAQVRDTEHKKDRNLKSSARINPSTLAMEFSLPLSEYPGRAGNSIPVTFNYSSKVWSMRLFDFKRIDQGGSGTQVSPYKFTSITSFLAEYGERTASGWTSSLQPIIFIPEEEAFNNSGGAQLENEVTCETVEEYWVYDDPACLFGKHVVIIECPTEEQFSEGNTQRHTVEFCYGGPRPDPLPGPLPGPGQLIPYYKVKRYRLRMPDGSTHEFRKDDKVFDCNIEPCAADSGVYLSVDGSGMRLIVGTQPNNESGIVLYLPDGGRYILGSNDTASTPAQKYIDRNGNQSVYDSVAKKWTDTMSREIVDPLIPSEITVGPKPFQLPGFNNQNRNYVQNWQQLKPDGCVTGSEASCQNSALENPSDTLYNLGTDTCQDREVDHQVSPSLFDNIDAPHTSTSPNSNNIWYQLTTKQRVCRGYIFNPIVLTEVSLPDGSKYKFKYNRYGEITKIIYPTGAYERFRYDEVTPVTFIDPPYLETNRGVVERWVSTDGITETQNWKYKVLISTTMAWGIVNTTIAPDNTKTETIFHAGLSSFGFEEPRGGMPLEEKVYSQPLFRNLESSRVLLRRTLTDWIVAPARTGGVGGTVRTEATRDPRVSRSVSIIFENGKALATLSKTDYDENGSSDPEYFSHLNVIRSKGYHYKVITDLTQAQEANIETIAAMFSESDLASVSETDYMYGTEGTSGYNYKQRGIIGLPTDTRVLNPTNPNPTSPDGVLAKSQIKYDETDYYPIIPPGTETGWQDPNSNLRGNATTTRTWVKDTDSWLDNRAQYDKFGNLRKAWDISGDSNRFTETEYSLDYNYAYPTKAITPAPGDGTYGTTEKSFATTSYDFYTGLPLSVTDEFGQTTKTEYDSMLRPRRVYAENFTAPETQTIYGVPNQITGLLTDNQRFVKVRKQIDETNWDEATTWFDGLGRTYKTQAKDSQGDVFVETQYDPLTGRVAQTSNPYRAGETKLWSKLRYDDLGRAVESFAPSADPIYNPGASLGITSFSISASGLVGTVVTSADASGRKGRSITNALGQVLRVDEPTSTGGTETGNLGAIENPIQPTYYTYDHYGKMVKVQQGKTGDATIQYRYFKYDSLGRLIRVRQPEQDVNAALYLPDSYNTSGQWTAAFAYDFFGNVKRATDANGVNIITEYDKANRIIKRCYTPPETTPTATECSQTTGRQNGKNTPSVEYWYDGKGLASEQSPNYAKGKLTKASSAISETRYTLFDNFGRLKESEQRTPFATETVAQATPRLSKYNYNLSGALSEQVYPSGRVIKNEFESDGDLMRIHGKAHQNAMDRTYASGFSYTPDGRIERLQLGNGLWESAKFDPARLQVTELALGHSAGDGSLWKLEYKYGELAANGVDVEAAKNTGNIAKQILSFNGLAQPLVQTYRYDSLYRLKEARETSGTTTTAPQTWKQVFDYDRFGNRTAFQKFIGTTQIALDSIAFPSINAQTNRLSDGQGYSYDRNGNVIVDAEGRRFTFNGDNKQTEVRNGSNVLVGNYYYDGEGKRVKKKIYDPNGVEQEETVFVYDGMGKLVAEYSTKPPPTNPTTSFTATDQLESPRVITNSLGEVISRRDFQPFGEEIVPDATYRKTSDKYGATDSVRQRFTGYQKDEETGLDFAEARMYENRHGRFTAVDPLLASGKGANPQTFNRYVYVMNNPLAFTDPSGLQVATRDDINNTPIRSCGRGRRCTGNIANDRKSITIYDPIGSVVSSMSEWAGEIVESIQSGVSDLFDYTANSDPLQNANYQQFGNVLDATSGSPEALESLNQRFIGNQGPTTFSVLQQTTENVNAAVTVAEWGFFAQNITLSAAGMVGTGSPNITTNLSNGTGSNSTNFFAGSIRNVNPFGCRTNCVNSALATDATLAGRPTSALRSGPTQVSVLEQHFGGRFIPMSREQINTTLLNSGNGARGIIFGSRGRIPGHVFNGVNQNGNIRFLDGQNGGPASWNGYRRFYFLQTNR